MVATWQNLLEGSILFGKRFPPDGRRKIRPVALYHTFVFCRFHTRIAQSDPIFSSVFISSFRPHGSPPPPTTATRISPARPLSTPATSPYRCSHISPARSSSTPRQYTRAHGRLLSAAPAISQHTFSSPGGELHNLQDGEVQP